MTKKNAKDAVTIFLFIDPLAAPCYEAEQAIVNFKETRSEDIRLQILPIINYKNIQEAVRNRSVFAQGRPLDIQNTLYLNVYHSCLAYIAASMQGRRKGRLVLSALQETVINYGEIFTIDLLMDITNKLNLDVEEFRQDFYSEFAKQCFRKNQQLAQDMNVSSTPSCIVSLNHKNVNYQLKGPINEHSLQAAFKQLYQTDLSESII
ncbi:DsbA family protein [Allofustis seminis]|uniref:DsbA family protein n=1 Tax=Allofustis seminis TaxID=166939 RepID=UPI0003797C1C|nr:DsbA family protein [Allofustis seminis]